MEMNDSITTLIEDLGRAADSTPELREAMLHAQADILEPALRSRLNSLGLVKTGKLMDSIGRTRGRKGEVLLVGPSGVHHRYIRRSGSGEVRSGHVGYVHEYGAPSRGIRPKGWMSGAVMSVAGKAVDAAEKVHDEYLKKHNL